ncbi:PD-(D/E)XK nuclease family protein [Buchananella felis]|uniref:UrvD/REP family ATP-dependent DNA helicase n=1 Tax=Buchananella felis TaxID=3231492 RepID=UPI003528573A
MTPLELELLPAPARPLPAPDPVQARVAAHVLAGGAAVVPGAPGTGKSTLALMVAGQVAGAGRQVVVLAASRQRAAALRDLLAQQQWPAQLLARIEVRTPPALALGYVRRWAVERDVPLPAPVLLTGAAADARLERLLAADDATGGAWPEHVPEATRRMRQFRAELRNLFDAVGSVGWGAAQLEEQGRARGDDAWVACARILAGYESQQRLDAEPERAIEIDHMRVCVQAARLLARWEVDAPAHGVSATRPAPDLVVVDDAQDLTVAATHLVDALEAGGARLVLLGDPDAAVETFRGGDPLWFAQRVRAARNGRGQGDDAPPGAPLMAVLPTRHRAGGAVALALRALSSLVPPLGEITRRAASHRSDSPWGEVRAVEARGVDEAAAVADLLRSEHVRAGVAWDQMAVLVRSGGKEEELSQELAALGVPVAPPRERLPLSDNPVVRSMLDVCQWAVSGQELEEAAAWRLVRGPLVGLDGLAERQLRRLLAAGRGEVGPGEVGPGGAALAAASAGTGPAAGATEADPVAAALAAQERQPLGLARLLQAEQADCGGLSGIERARRIVRAARAAAGPGARPGQLLWAVWEAADQGSAWQAKVIAAAGKDVPERLSVAALERNLDSVVELARRADLWEQANPGGRFAAFLASVEAGVVRSDSIAASAQRPPVVEVLTPAGAAGRQWHTVVIAGLDEGRWPNTTLRDSFLGAGVVRALARAQRLGEEWVDDPLVAVQEVVADEARLLISAAGRAGSHLFLLSDPEVGQSRFLPLLEATLEAAAQPGGTDVAGKASGAAGAGHPRGAEGREPGESGAPDSGTPGSGEVWAALPRQSTLPAYVATLRRLLLDEAAAGRRPDPTDPRVRLLAVLAQVGVAGADPSQWRALAALTPGEKLVPDGQKARISPSGVDYALKCPARWALQRFGGQSLDTERMELGTLVHAFAEAYPLAEQATELSDALERWCASQAQGTLQERRYIETVRAMVQALASYTQAIACQGIETEVKLSVEEPTRVISGRIDRLELVAQSDGSKLARIVDFKTGNPDTDHTVMGDNGRRQSKLLAGHPQLGIYQYLLERGELRERGVAGAQIGRLVNLKKVTRGEPLVQEQAELRGDHAWVEAILDQAEAMQRGQSFAALPGTHCNSCPVQTSCPAQRKGKRTR